MKQQTSSKGEVLLKMNLLIVLVLPLLKQRTRRSGCRPQGTILGVLFQVYHRDIECQ